MTPVWTMMFSLPNIDKPVNGKLYRPDKSMAEVLHQFDRDTTFGLVDMFHNMYPPIQLSATNNMTGNTSKSIITILKTIEGT